MALSRALPLAFVFAAGLLSSAATAQPRPVLLEGLGEFEPGQWQLKAEGAAPRNLCIAGADALVQVRHPANPCGRFVVAQDKGSATVHYSCPGAGWGRTTVRMSTSRLIHIDTQGIADNAPFAFAAEARRVGDCSSATRSR